MSSPLSDAEILARALWLVNNPLVDTRTRDFDDCEPHRQISRQIKLRLETLGFRDERAAERAAERICKSPPPLIDNFDRLGQQVFIQRQGLPVLHASLLCRRLVRIIDPDILTCFHSQLTPSREDRFDWSVVPLCDDGETADTFREGSIDTHIHLGGTLPPLFFWVSLMSGELPLDMLKSFPTKDRGHARTEDWQWAIARAMWLRLDLARTVQRMWPASMPVFRRLPHPALEEKPTPKMPKTLDEIRDAVLATSIAWRLNRSLSKGWSSIDPLRSDDTFDYHYAEGERRLLYYLGRYLRRPREAGPTRNCVESSLLEYLRIRNAFHQLLIHDYGTDGLRRFVETFGRRGFQGGRRRPFHDQRRRQRRHQRLMLALERSRMTAALNKQLVTAFDDGPVPNRNQPPRRIEMRVSIPGGHELLHTLRAWLAGLHDHLQAAPHRYRNSQMGLLFHLIKGGDGEQAAEKAYETARRLGNLLEDYPELRPFIIGIDAAGAERGSPPRTFAKAFACLRQLQAKHRARANEPRIRLGWTYHVGEDVDDLLTGLRHLDEVATLLLGPEGGRLGHALTLGEEPARFYRRRGGQTEPTLGDHLLDLVWAYGRLSEARQVEDCPWLIKRIRDFGIPERADLTIINCYRAMDLDSAGKEEVKTVFREPELLTKLGFEGNFEYPITCPADEQWLRLVGQLQQLLRRRLARKRLCIEVNPTSNLIIGGYDDYGKLPYNTLIADGLAVSLNTDDPGLFVTSLPGEFSAMYRALTRDKTHRQALAWLADRRFDAERSTFLGPHVPMGINASKTTSPRNLDRLFRYDPE
ncbi:MAG: hypothetical protein RKP20_01635 [Candidatus Competibacter sp.]|nr:hypothetical protein [Candidatus Competibacter sp.]